MLLKDTENGYGVVSRVLHWAMAVAIVALFALGWWMVGLTYYSPYYNSAPALHRSVGIIVLALLVLRFTWRVSNPKPHDRDLSPLERKASWLGHWGFYPLLFVMMVSGYLISTPDGRPIDVFGLFSVPSLFQQKGLEDAAGFVHEMSAYAVMILAAVHTAAALKHHFVDKTTILTRMWSGPPHS
jgi:cytochrome b561